MHTHLHGYKREDISNIKFKVEPTLYKAEPSQCRIGKCTIMLDPHNRREVKNHILEHLKAMRPVISAGYESYPCTWTEDRRDPHCGYYLPADYIYQHIVRYHLPTARKYWCQLCDLGYDFRNDCKEHMMEDHGATRFKKLRKDSERIASTSASPPPYDLHVQALEMQPWLAKSD